MKKLLILFFIGISITTKSWANENINILYTINEKYSIPCLLSINSILLNNISNNDYTFYIIENNLSEKRKNFIKNFIEKRKHNIVFININNETIQKYDYGSPYITYLSPIAAARLYADKYIPKNIDKIIYLDSDTLITTDLKELYDIDLENNIAGLVRNDGASPYPKKMYHFKNGYYNSGVIILNLKKSREEKSSEQFENYFTQNIDKFTIDKTREKSFFYLIDQDLISIVWDGRIKPLDYKWNIQEHDITQQEKGIYHYIGNAKPWCFVFSNKNLKQKTYMKYWEKSPELRKYKHLFLLKTFYYSYISKVRYIYAQQKVNYKVAISFLENKL